MVSCVLNVSYWGLFIMYMKMWYSVCYSVIHSGIAWIEFLNSNDNLGDIVTHLREGDMRGAQLLWLRYEVKNNFMPVFVICQNTFILLTMVNYDDETKHYCVSEQVVIVYTAVFCDRERLQKSLMRTSLKLCSVPSQRTCRPKNSVPGFGQCLFLLWGKCSQQDRYFLKPKRLCHPYYMALCYQ